MESGQEVGFGKGRSGEGVFKLRGVAGVSGGMEAFGEHGVASEQGQKERWQEKGNKF
jgi:hypothetical protein